MHARPAQRSSLRDPERAAEGAEHATGHLETHAGAPFSFDGAESRATVVDGDGAAAVGGALYLDTDSSLRSCRPARVVEDVGKCALDGSAIHADVFATFLIIDVGGDDETHAVDEANRHLVERTKNSRSAAGVNGMLADA
jgi:hypothetical protein